MGALRRAEHLGQEVLGASVNLPLLCLLRIPLEQLGAQPNAGHLDAVLHVPLRLPHVGSEHGLEQVAQEVL
eukprot:3873173-Lingulodinium_polyedra.AAC.1